MSAGKSPYELRADLLHLAFDILRNKHAAAGAKGGDSATTAPTTEEIIAEAEKLNQFISQTPRNK